MSSQKPPGTSAEAVKRGHNGSWPDTQAAQVPQGTWCATATRVPAGNAPATTTPDSSCPSTDPAAAPPGTSFSASEPHSPQ